LAKVGKCVLHLQWCEFREWKGLGAPHLTSNEVGQTNGCKPFILNNLAHAFSSRSSTLFFPTPTSGLTADAWMGPRTYLELVRIQSIAPLLVS
jgi:hypothetical protein